MGDKVRILVIEDETKLADVIADSLRKEKYIVDIANDGEEGLYSVMSNSYNLVILDVMLPYVNGFDILKKIRDKKIDTKVIMLTAKSELDDKLNGLENGANDYMTKPFHIKELIARVNIQLRKDNKNIDENYISIGNIKLDLKTSKLICNDTEETIELGSKEFYLLEYLMQNKDIVVSKEQIYDRVWGINNEIESNNLEAYMSFIRKKLKIIGANVNIRALRNLGYKIEVKDEEIKK